ncbi:lytic transglycosylase domain-containing protein [Actinoplanes sp. NPDC049118]|uniref:lytic transglycosylase domain-containing protein n=1 Tax=Actinoplanes sp. NPDC049118 TaxID=3155769 RepID=UPI0033E475D8
MNRRMLWPVAALATLLVVAGCGFVGGDEDPPLAAPVASASEPENIVDPVIESGEPAPEPTTPSPSPSKSRAKPKATPTEDPNNFQLPACAHREGKEVSKSKAKSALTSAAARKYWPTSAPGLKVPSRLVLTTAWHESGWTSNIVNCDGGRGLMQVMPDTEAFINQRFEQSYESTDYRQNAVLGANYLAWLTKAFGDQYFKGSYDLSAGKCKTHRSMCLLNLVIAGYNAGRAAVDEAYGSGRLPNPEYVDVVRALMKSCYCDRY